MKYSRKRKLDIYTIEKVIAGYIENFLRDIGIDVSVSADDIMIDNLKKPVGGFILSMTMMDNSKSYLIVLNDSILGLTKARNLDELLQIIDKNSGTIKHEAYHYGIRKKYGDIDIIKEQGIEGGYSEGLAYLISLYEALKREHINIIESNRQFFVDKLYQSGIYLTLEQSKKILSDLINREREYLLINEKYKDVIIAILWSCISRSLSHDGSSAHNFYKMLNLALYMAKVAIDMLHENYKKYGNLEEALKATLANYPEYRERVIREFQKVKRNFIAYNNS